MRKKSWTAEQLFQAVKTSVSVAGVIRKLGLIPAGGNYNHISRYLKTYKLDTHHFTGSRWNIGMKGRYLPQVPLSKILRKNSVFQSYKLKKRLYIEKLKQPLCEECGWAKMSEDGRIPLELDHVNGDKYDNRIENLRILCPNCHSLKMTHRGKNKRNARVA